MQLRRVALCIVCGLLACAGSVAVPDVVQVDAAAPALQPGAAGVVTQSGLNLVKQVLVDLGLPLIKTLQIPNGEFCTSGPFGIKECLSYSNVKISSVSPGNFQALLEDGDRLRLVSPDAQVEGTFAFKQSVLGLGCSAVGVHLTAALDVTATRAPNTPSGQPQLKSLAIAASVNGGQSGASFTGCGLPDTLVQWVVDLFLPHAWGLVHSDIHKAGPPLVDLVNKELREFSLVIPIPDVEGLAGYSADLSLTNGNTPLKGAVQLDAVAEIFATSGPRSGMSPDRAAALTLSNDSKTTMPCTEAVCIYTTTFPVNSFSTAMFHKQGQSYNITSQIARANLTTDYFKDIIPSMAEKYPGWQIVVGLEAASPLQAHVIPDGLNGTGAGLVNIYVQETPQDPPLGPVLYFGADVVAGVTASVVRTVRGMEAVEVQVLDITSINNIRILKCTNPDPSVCVRVPWITKVVLESWFTKEFAKALVPSLLAKINDKLNKSQFQLPTLFGVSVQNAKLSFSTGLGGNFVVVAADLAYKPQATDDVAYISEAAEMMNDGAVGREDSERPLTRRYPSLHRKIVVD